jgi:hypothetical protein
MVFFATDTTPSVLNSGLLFVSTLYENFLFVDKTHTQSCRMKLSQTFVNEKRSKSDWSIKEIKIS